MSSDNDLSAAALPAATEKCCASCGIAAIDEIKLKPCPHCDLVKYCNDQCQKDHLKEHEDACKERAAKLYDEILFKQPESSHLGDCPICFLPMSIDVYKNRAEACCGQIICRGCIHASNVARRFKENRCPFCRHLAPRTDEEIERLNTERAELNDPNALRGLAKFNFLRGDYESAFKYWNRAAALVDAESLYNLSIMYGRGEGVEKDMDKRRALLEKASIVGHPAARYNLGCYEANYGRFDRAVKHWIIAASLGEDTATKALTKCYKNGHLKKEDFAAALRAHQAAVDAMKSPQRQAAELWDACFNDNE